MGLVMALNDGDTFTDLAGCRIVDVPEDADIEDYLKSRRGALYTFSGDETGGVALTDRLEERVVEAIEQQQSYTDGPDSLDAHRGRPLYDALLALARACDIEVTIPREEP